jgi:hypothetical protein
VTSPELASPPILRGRLEDLDFGSLLSALRLGRQYLTLEVYDATGDCTGVVAVKAGQIVSASVDGYTGLEAVRRLLETRDAAEFRVLPQPVAAELAAEPLGTIASITQALSQQSTESEVGMLIARTQVMQGTLSEQLGFEDVLRGLSFTRQHVTLALSDTAGRALGEVGVKANKVVSARAGGLVALPALQQLRRAPSGSQFALFVESHSVAHLHPLGSVGEVLERTAVAPAHTTARLTRTANGAHTAPSQTLTWTQGAQTTPGVGRVLEGSLEEFKLPHVLNALSTSRQHFEVQVRDETAATIGVIEVKSGVVVAANTARLRGAPAAHELLRTHKGHFVAVRRVEDSAELPALLSLHELLQPPAAASRDDTPSVVLTRAVEVSAPPTEAISVMNGQIGDLDVASILHVAGSSRQYTCVQIFDDQRTQLGAVYLKSGQVVRAQAQDVTGVAAVRRLLHCPSDFSFLVQRYPNSAEATSSIGSIADILTRAASQPTAAAAVSTHSPSQPRAAATTGWMGGAALGGGFVLLGGIAAALVLRAPALTTSYSPISVQEKSTPVPAELAPAREEARIEPAKPPAQADEAAPAEEPPAKEPSSASTSMSRALIASLQAGLHQLGYATGPVDGVLGPRTQAAIRAFQYAEHLTVDGTLNAPTRAVLLRRMEEP